MDLTSKTLISEYFFFSNGLQYFRMLPFFFVSFNESELFFGGKITGTF